MPRAAWRTAASKAGSGRGVVRVTVETAATTWPVRSWMGAAIELDPGVISSDILAMPRARMSASRLRSTSGAVMVEAVNWVSGAAR
jgi:hypothetical protein